MITTSPWPGPGDSEGPPDPEGCGVPVNEDSFGGGTLLEEGLDLLFSTEPWPGPANSEGEPPMPEAAPAIADQASTGEAASVRSGGKSPGSPAAST